MSSGKTEQVKIREDILAPNNIVWWYYSEYLGVCDEIHICVFYICIVLYDCQSIFLNMAE